MTSPNPEPDPQVSSIAPTLAIVGFRLYELTATNDTVTMLLTRRQHVTQSGVIHCRYIAADIAFELKGQS